MYILQAALNSETYLAGSQGLEEGLGTEGFSTQGLGSQHQPDMAPTHFQHGQISL